MSILLGVNIDHVATLRQARGTRYPEPLHAALLAEEAGADVLPYICAKTAVIFKSVMCDCWYKYYKLG